MIKVGHGTSVATIEISMTLIELPSFHILVLRDCLLLLTGFKNIISILLLVKENPKFFHRQGLPHLLL